MGFGNNHPDRPRTDPGNAFTLHDFTSITNEEFSSWRRSRHNDFVNSTTLPPYPRSESIASAGLPTYPDATEQGRLVSAREEQDHITMELRGMGYY